MGPEVRRVVISAEQCSGLLTEADDVARLRDLLAPRFGAVRVVIYLRRQDLHAASGYAQSLRTARIRAPALPAGGPDRLPDYDYAALLARWAEAFGEASVTPRIFEPDALPGGDVVDDFLALCGLALRIPSDDPDRRSNLSVAPGGLALMLAMGRHLRGALPGGLTASSSPWRRFVQAVSEALPGPGWRPEAEEAAAFLARFAAANEAVRSRWFPDRAALFATDDLATPATGAPGAPPLAVGAALEAACVLLVRELEAARAAEARHAVQLARLYERAGDPGAARRSYAAALRAAPEHAEAHFGLGALAAQDPDTAGAHLAALRRGDGADRWAHRLERRMQSLRRAPEALAPPGDAPM